MDKNTRLALMRIALGMKKARLAEEAKAKAEAKGEDSGKVCPITDHGRDLTHDSVC